MSVDQLCGCTLYNVHMHIQYIHILEIDAPCSQCCFCPPEHMWTPPAAQKRVHSEECTFFLEGGIFGLFQILYVDLQVCTMLNGIEDRVVFFFSHSILSRMESKDVNKFSYWFNNNQLFYGLANSPHMQRAIF